MKRIFISSVQKEFERERAAIKKMVESDPILKPNFKVFVFEIDAPASDKSTQQVYLKEIEKSDIYLLLVGNKYGYCKAGEVSPTEREFDKAFAFQHQSDCVFFLPRHTASGADSPWYSYREWASSDGNQHMYGTNPRLVFYGPNAEDLDIEGADGDNDGKITFIPRAVHALTNVLSSASTVSRNLDLAVTVSVTNAIDLTNVEITEDMAKSAAYANLMFSAKTQTQLDAILGAFPATTPISIDSTGLTEDMTIPNDYPNVFVKTVPGVTVRRTSKGFVIIFK